MVCTFFLYVFLYIAQLVLCSTDLEYASEGYTEVVVNVTYVDPQSGRVISYRMEKQGFYGENKVAAVSGLGVHVLTISNRTGACEPLLQSTTRTEPWIALVQRGVCNFNKKIRNAAVGSNASAVLVYNDDAERELIAMKHNCK